MDKNEEVFRGLVDSIIGHPSTKPHLPTSTREVQLEAEIRALRAEINRMCAVIQLAVDRMWERTATDPTLAEESPF